MKYLIFTLLLLVSAEAQATSTSLPPVSYGVAPSEDAELAKKVLPLVQKALPLRTLQLEVAQFFQLDRPDFFADYPTSITLRGISESRLPGVKGEIYIAEVSFTATEPNLQWTAIQSIALHQEGGVPRVFYKSPVFQGDCGAAFYNLAMGGLVRLAKAELAVLKISTGLTGCATYDGAKQELLRFFDAGHGMAKVPGEFETAYSNSEETWDSGHPWREGRVATHLDLSACSKKACDEIPWEKESTFGGSPKKTKGILRLAGSPLQLYAEKR
jgi:hypothetical protein